MDNYALDSPDLAAQHESPESAKYAEGEGITLDEANQRLDQEAAVSSLTDFVTTNDTQFDGFFSEPEGGQMNLVVRYVDGTALLSQAVSFVPEGVNVTFEAAEYSGAELAEVAASIAADVQAAIKGGTGTPTDIETITPDEHTNRVIVTGQNESAVLGTAAKYGEIVTTRLTTMENPALGPQVACSWSGPPNGDYWGESRFKCWPNRGGIEVQTISGNDHENHCTNTMWVRHNSYGTKWEVTAGHCGNLTAGSWQMYHNGVAIGDAATRLDNTVWKELNGPDCVTNPTGSCNSDFRMWRDPSPPTTSLNEIYRSNAVGGFTPDDTSSLGSGIEGTSQRCISGTGAGIRFEVYQQTEPLYDGGNYPYDTDPWTCGVLSENLLWITTEQGLVMQAAYGDLDGTANGSKSRHVGLSGGDSGAPIFGLYSGIQLLHGAGEQYVYTANENGYAAWSFATEINTDLNVSWCKNTDCSTWIP